MKENIKFVKAGKIRAQVTNKEKIIFKQGKEIKILRKALELACCELCFDDIADLSYRMDYFIVKAKECLHEQKET